MGWGGILDARKQSDLVKTNLQRWDEKTKKLWRSRKGEQGNESSYRRMQSYVLIIAKTDWSDVSRERNLNLEVGIGAGVGRAGLLEQGA